jgi:hypothetical protein
VRTRKHRAPPRAMRATGGSGALCSALTRRCVHLRSFASGTDVFGRAAPCRACHALLHNLQARARKAACARRCCGLSPLRCALYASAALTRRFRCRFWRAQGTLVPRLTAQMQRDARRSGRTRGAARRGGAREPRACAAQRAAGRRPGACRVPTRHSEHAGPRTAWPASAAVATSTAVSFMVVASWEREKVAGWADFSACRAAIRYTSSCYLLTRTWGREESRVRALRAAVALGGGFAVS